MLHNQIIDPDPRVPVLTSSSLDEISLVAALTSIRHDEVKDTEYDLRQPFDVKQLRQALAHHGLGLRLGLAVKSGLGLRFRLG